MPIRFALLLMAWIVNSGAEACHIRWLDRNEQKRNSNAGVEAVVLSTDGSRPYFWGVNFDYTVDVVALESGHITAGRMRLTFDDRRMHRRGESTVCPLKNGSGIEHALKVGSGYRMYLDTRLFPALVLAEPIDRPTPPPAPHR